MYDATKPVAPVVSSTHDPDDDAWHRGVGDHGTFSLYSPGTDVVSYRYQITGEPWKTVMPPEPGRAATLRCMAQREDPYSMIVRAVDAAGNTKETPNAYTFLVDEGRPLLGAWALADPVGSDQAAGGYDGPDATVGPGVTFGVDGPHGSLRTGAQLDGTSGAYLSAGQRVIDTDKTFAVAAWVMLPEVPTSSMTVISRDGSAQSGFSLGFDGESKRIAVCPPGSCQPSGDPCG